MTTSQPLYEQYLSAKAAHPRKYARDLATLLGMREAQLMQTRVGHDACRLKSDFRAILSALESVGETKSITRNEYAVHEQVGRYENQHLNGHAGLVLNPRALDLRLFLMQWASAFHLAEMTPRGERKSIQFFDKQGDAVLKVYATEQTGQDAWQALLTEFTCDDNPLLAITPAVIPAENADVDATQVEREWQAMTDVHQFFQLLKRHAITRQQAFRLVSDELAQQVDNDALARLLTQVKQESNEIMIFVGNTGCVQIFTGEIKKLQPMDNWLNIFNPDFTLHLQADQIAESWITRKPTTDGFVTSLELFAADGTQIAQLYGQRTEGQPEQEQWRKQLATLTQAGLAA